MPNTDAFFIYQLREEALQKPPENNMKSVHKCKIMGYQL